MKKTLTFSKAWSRRRALLDNAMQMEKTASSLRDQARKWDDSAHENRKIAIGEWAGVLGSARVAGWFLVKDSRGRMVNKVTLKDGSKESYR